MSLFDINFCFSFRHSSSSSYFFFYKHIPNCWKVSTAQDFPYSMSQKHICLFFGFFYIPIIFSHVVINLPLSNNNFYLHIINQNVFIYTKPRSTSDCPWGSVIIICIISVLAMVDIFKKAHEKKTSNPEPLKSKFEYYFGHTTL